MFNLVYNMLLLSTLAYLDIPKIKSYDLKKEKIYVKNIFEDNYTIYNKSKYNIIKEKYEPIRNYRIIGYTRQFNGLCCYALLYEGQVTFAFSGTERFKINDYYTDFKMAIGVDLENIGQFNSAVEFVKSIINKYSQEINIDKELYFTGHSLGGSLASYCSYKFYDKLLIQGITFSGAGIYQNIKNPIILPNNSCCIDYSFSDDIVGVFGTEVGIQKLIVTKHIFLTLKNHSIENFYDYISLDKLDMRKLCTNCTVFDKV